MRKLRGFTLIELLAVIAIIGILAALAAISISNATRRARDAQRQRDLANLKTALELYAQDNGTYPVTASGGSLNDLKPDYIKGEIPLDPQDKSNYDYTGTAEDFLLVAHLEYKSAKATLPSGSCAGDITQKGNGVTAAKDSPKRPGSPCFRLTND